MLYVSRNSGVGAAEVHEKSSKHMLLLKGTPDGGASFNIIWYILIAYIHRHFPINVNVNTL